MNAACPPSTGGGTRLIRLVRGRGGGGGGAGRGGGGGGGGGGGLRTHLPDDLLLFSGLLSVAIARVDALWST